MQILGTAEAESTDTSRLLAWGPIFLTLILAGIASALVWFKGDLFGVLTREAKLGASVWIFLVLVAVLLLHVGLLFGGAYRLVGRAFRAEIRDRGAAVKQTKRLKRDARLQTLCDELRATRGWSWRYRTRWLLLNGTDALIDDVAPGLKRAGVMPVADAILVHAAPDGIDAGEWRRQIRQLRRRRPVDSVVHVTDANTRETELPRALAGLATDLGWAAPVTLLHTVPAKGGLPESFETIGAFPGPSLRGTQPASALREQLATIGRHTADAGVQLCATPARVTYLAQISHYIDEQCESIISGWNALFASHWHRSQLTGVMFAPVFESTVAAPAPVPLASTALAGAEAFVSAGTQRPGLLQNQPAALLPAWQTIALRRGTGRRVGFYWPNVLAWSVIVAAVAWCVWMTVSFVGNQQLAREAQATANAAINTRPQTAVAWRAQLALQQLIEKLEYRQQHGAPWYLRGGLSRNDEVLAGLWLPYRTAATRNLQTPVMQTIDDLFKAAGQARADSLESQDTRSGTYNALKTYLMLGVRPVPNRRSSNACWCPCGRVRSRCPWVSVTIRGSGWRGFMPITSRRILNGASH